MAPDKAFPKRLTYYSQIRVELHLSKGNVDAFRIQLEYGPDALADPVGAEPSWEAAARFDHSPNSVNGHDIREEGLHLDLCNSEGVARRKQLHKMPVNVAPDYCQQYLEQHHDELIQGYEKRTGVPPYKRKIRRV